MWLFACDELASYWRSSLAWTQSWLELALPSCLCTTWWVGGWTYICFVWTWGQKLSMYEFSSFLLALKTHILAIVLTNQYPDWGHLFSSCLSVVSIRLSAIFFIVLLCLIIWDCALLLCQITNPPVAGLPVLPPDAHNSVYGKRPNQLPLVSYCLFYLYL